MFWGGKQDHSYKKEKKKESERGRVPKMGGGKPKNGRENTKMGGGKPKNGRGKNQKWEGGKVSKWGKGLKGTKMGRGNARRLYHQEKDGEG